MSETTLSIICDLCSKQDTDKYKFLYQSCWNCRNTIDVCLECSENRPLICKECKEVKK